MKIIILGAGQVGASLARDLAADGHAVTVVDADRDNLARLEDFDVRLVHGHPSYPAVLRDAGAEDSELLVAVTESDETNMVACQIAYTLFQTPTKIARVRAQEYIDEPRLFRQDALPIDMHISPAHLVTESILRLIEHPGALQVVDFADGRVRLVGLRAYYGGPLVGHRLRELPDHLKDVDARVAAIYRRGRPIIPEGDTIVETEDEVFFLADARHIGKMMDELRRKDKKVERVMLAGGGNIGLALAQQLDARGIQVKLIERSRARARLLGEQLPAGVVVLHGDCADEKLLVNENIEDMDVYCAITNDDEANILSAMLAKRLGAGKALSLINRSSYIDLVEGSAIDVAISPQQATVSALLARVRHGEVVRVYSLRRGAAEAIEAIAHGDRHNSKVVGRRLDEIPLPEGTTIGAVVRGDEVIIAHHDTVIESGDHVILFIVDRRNTAKVGELFNSRVV